MIVGLPPFIAHYPLALLGSMSIGLCGILSSSQLSCTPLLDFNNWKS